MATKDAKDAKSVEAQSSYENGTVRDEPNVNHEVVTENAVSPQAQPEPAPEPDAKLEPASDSAAG